jgi:hypothetical protein
MSCEKVAGLFGDSPRTLVNWARRFDGKGLASGDMKTVTYSRFENRDLLRVDLLRGLQKKRSTFGVDLLPPLTRFFGGIEGREWTGLKLAGDERRGPAQLFPLQSIVCTGLPAST